MTEPMTPEQEWPTLTRSRFELTFEVTGEPFTPKYSPESVKLKPSSVTVAVELRGGVPDISSIRVDGSRARKDGSHSSTGMSRTYWSRSIETWEVPPYIMAAGEEALRLVRDMLRGTGEVTV